MLQFDLQFYEELTVAWVRTVKFISGAFFWPTGQLVILYFRMLMMHIEETPVFVELMTTFCIKEMCNSQDVVITKTQLALKILKTICMKWFISLEWSSCKFALSLKPQSPQATVCCKVGAATLVHLRPGGLGLPNRGFKSLYWMSECYRELHKQGIRPQVIIIIIVALGFLLLSSAQFIRLLAI